MSISGRVRKTGLSLHVISSVAWLGSVMAFIALAVAGIVSAHDPQVVRAVYPSMELIAWSVIVPISLASLVTGITQALTTEWGLFRHYWVLAKFLLTTAAVALLLLHMTAVKRAAALAPTGGTVALTSLQNRLLVDACLTAGVLLIATALSVFKPWGMTPYGWRKQNEAAERAGRALQVPSASRRFWPYALAAAGLLIGVVILHVTGVVGHH